MERVDFRILLASFYRGRGYSIPLFDQLLQVVCHVLLELRNRFCTKGMRNRFAFPRVFCTITCIEQTPVDGDEGVIVITVSSASASICMSYRRSETEMLG